MSFAGTWECSIETPIGRQDVTFHIKEQNGTYSGTAVGAETVPLLDPVVKGAHMQWTQKTTKPMPLTVKFDVTQNGDDLSGTAKAGIFPSVQVNGRRLSRAV